MDGRDVFPFFLVFLYSYLYFLFIQIYSYNVKQKSPTFYQSWQQVDREVGAHDLFSYFRPFLYFFKNILFNLNSLIIDFQSKPLSTLVLLWQFLTLKTNSVDSLWELKLFEGWKFKKSCSRRSRREKFSFPRAFNVRLK